MNATGPTHGRAGRRGAFTLMELLIVVAIIAILAAIAIPNFLDAQVRTRVNRCAQDMQLLADRLDAYAVDQGDLPPNAVAPQAAPAEGLAGAPPPPGPVGPPALGSSGYRSFGPSKNANDWTTFQDSNYPALCRLTTPVAYLGRLPTDSFADNRGTVLVYWRLEPADAAAWPGVRAIILSVGPDADWSVSKANRVRESILYDPTNGTNSAGDLILTIPYNAEFSNVAGEN